jgi:hypothetical protein
MQAFKLIGISDETTCECCGKENLKLTVVLDRLDAEGNGMEFVKFGRDCAARALKMRCTAGRMETLARNAEHEAKKKALNTVHNVGNDRSVINWIIESVGSNGGSFEFLALANGSRKLVEKWADEKFPKYAGSLIVRNPNN